MNQGNPAGSAKIGAANPGGAAKPGAGAAGAIGHPGAVAGTVTPVNGGGVAGARAAGVNRAGIASQSLGGNTINIQNRNISLANNNYRPAFYGHGLYHGYWNGNYGFGGGYGSGWGGGYGPGWGWGLGGYGGGYGFGGYGFRPLGWGLGAWGLGALAYNSGYLGYSNPYYSGGSGFGGGFNYAQPIPVVYNSPSQTVANDPESADGVLNAAIGAFKQADYDAALDLINKGISQFPNDSVMHEFRGLVLFAKGDYQQAAATIHSVLAVGPGWDWTTLASLYSNIAIYTDQLRALESFVRNQPQDGASRFLVAYHYMTAGHTAAAAKQLQQVVALVPDDKVAADVLKMIAAPKTGSEALSAEKPTPQPPQEPNPGAAPGAKPVDPAALVGTWRASRGDSSKFELILTKEGTFTWKFSQTQQPAQEFTGKYTVEVNVLALEKDDGGSLIAEVTSTGAKTFNFRLVGAPPDDKGLDFIR
ncbi:MAG TPA: tetratricopeptide repeat protein [Bryobacteraceae bacterium]|nr:tetratricopeptide repeat protein [Bryobacteraceae bacterium]